jgi:hypothetical protein
MINSLIITTLSPMGVPVGLRRYTGFAQSYITFFEYNEQGAFWAQNQETATSYFMQIDVWSKPGAAIDVEDLAAQALSALTAAGFKRTMCIDLGFEPDTQIYHRVIRATYVDV